MPPPWPRQAVADRVASGGRSSRREDDEVEPISLTVGAVVASLVLKGAGKAGEKMAETGLAAIGRLVERVRGRFQDHGDADGERALARIENPPAGPSQLADLAAAVDRHAGEDPAFADELRRLVNDAKSAGVDVRNAAQVAWGSQISQIQGVSGSAISVSIGRPQSGEKPTER